MTNQPHPELGHGLGVFLTLRLRVDANEAARAANLLNLHQFKDGETIAAFGAWCVRQGEPCAAEPMGWQDSRLWLTAAQATRRLATWRAVNVKWSRGGRPLRERLGLGFAGPTEGA